MYVYNIYIYIYTYLHICMSTYDVVLGPPTPIVSTTPSATAKFVDMFNTGPIYIYILSLSLCANLFYAYKS